MYCAGRPGWRRPWPPRERRSTAGPDDAPFSRDVIDSLAVPDAAGGLAIPRLQRPLIAIRDGRNWLPTWSSAAALRAVRATVVVAGLFALTDKVIGNLQMATFAAFGGFATLVLSSFAGSRRDKLLAHTALALAGSVLLTIGTAVNASTPIAAIVTVPVTFLVF